MANPFQDERFLPLRDMESFTDDMFNRLLAFQEKKHPAWDEAAPFSERIKGLPLHNLVFSNPDRDPETMAPTIAHYYPLREELRTIAWCARQVGKDPVICDLHAGNGFVGSLLAREGVSVIGVRDPALKPNQIRNFYDPDFYRLRDMAIPEIKFQFDVAFSSWMPAGVNITPEILRHRPRLIVFTYTDHEDNEGNRLCGTPESFNDLPESYRMIAEWDITRPENLFHEVWPDLTPSPEQVRITRIFADEPFHDISVSGAQPATPYEWENDLQMALLALEAKEALRQQGIAVD
jgi:hypothetical protein